MTAPMATDALRLHSREVERLVAGCTTTPLDPSLEADIEEAFLDALAGVPMGSPYAFLEQYGGRIVQDVRPAPGHEVEVSSRGRVPLRLHTDDAFLEASVRAEHLAFVCLINPQRVPTLLVALDEVLLAVEAETVATLCQPAFQFAIPASFDLDEKGTPRPMEPRPVLRERADGWFEVALSTRLSNAPGSSPDAAVHLDLFRSAADRARRDEVALAPGEILVLSNSRCLHGRPAVRSDRWMKRVYLRGDFGVLDRVASTGTAGVYAAAKALQYAARTRPCW